MLRREYQAVLVEAAENAAALLNECHRSGLPRAEMESLLCRAWLMGWNASRDERHANALKESAKCSQKS